MRYRVRDMAGVERYAEAEELHAMHPMELQELLVWLEPMEGDPSPARWTRGSMFRPPSIESLPDGTVVLDL